MGDVLTAGLLVSGARRIVLGAIATGMAMAATGCGPGSARVQLPAKPLSASRLHTNAAAASRAKPSPREQVIAAYGGYWRAMSRAVDSGSPVRARAILARYLPPAAIPGLIRGLRLLWQHNETSYGGPVLHIKAVSISARGSAAVHDCLDMSDYGLADRRTGEILGGLGQSHENLITTLVLRNGRWLVAGETPVARTCSY